MPPWTRFIGCGWKALKKRSSNARLESGKHVVFENVDFQDDKIHDHCGVFGIWRHPQAGNLTYYGLYALQHRGQESAGICVDTGSGLKTITGPGYVSEVFREQNLIPSGEIAIGHVRYSTAGGTGPVNAQPLLTKTRFGEIALCHNGNLVDYESHRHVLQQESAVFVTTSDTEIILHLIARSRESDLVSAIIDALSQVRGAYTLLLQVPGKIIGVRDPRGFRPLVLGSLNGSHVLASETCALDILQAEFVREVTPGEMVVLSDQGIQSFFPFEKAQPCQCIFEHVYFARPDSMIFDRRVYDVRMRLGRRLAQEHPASADVVVPVPDSGLVAALGYAEESKIPFAFGLTRNHYVGRTFIQPYQEGRSLGVRMKLNAVPSVLGGKRVVLVDDSIVRGTTCRKIVSIVREGGAREVHMRISCPPYVSPCLYGIDTPSKEELIANRMNLNAIREEIGADSLGYLSLEGLKAAAQDKGDFCTACFTGQYPITPPSHDVPGLPGLFDDV
jgi:amidophosphoribosyltransferase